VTEQGWRDAVQQATTDEQMAELLVRLLLEQDQAKQALRAKGYGWTGLSLLKSVELVPESGE
jgi:hypothetical protein